MGGGLWNRKLSDLTVGDAVKGWVGYSIAGAVVSLIVGVIFISSIGPADPLDRMAGPNGFGDGAVVPSSGRALTPAQFRSIHVGDRKQDVIARFGTPPSTDAPQAGVSPQYYSDCAVYRHRGRPASEYVICFDSGRVTEKTAL